ncbi:MAG: DUF3857 domain-containing protein [Steroidobacter sp.]
MTRTIMAIQGLGVLVCALASGICNASSWSPISPDELKMTSEPKAPGASAIILELQNDEDDDQNKITEYQRIKIFTDEGRSYGNIEIAYDKSADESVSDIEARVIHPDGTVIDFDGEIYDKLIVKAHKEKYQAKVFSLPAVSTGSIIEYRYVKHFFPHYEVYTSRWVLSQKLFVKHAMYTLVPNKIWQVRWSWPQGLPPGTPDPALKSGRVVLETHDVPAFVEEEYMPPRLEMQYRVDFVYNILHIDEKTDPEKFWKDADRLWYQGVSGFIDHSRAMEKVVAHLLQPGDSPEQKLRKLYTHVQQLRNLTFEKKKTDQENKRDETRNIHNVANMEDYGYGNEHQLTFLYVALARAAGFQADVVFTSTRDTYFFDPNVMNPSQLNSAVAVVTVDGKDVFLEPGVPFVPFAMLPWYQSDVSGLRLGKDGGTWVKIPLTKAEQAETRRQASFTLDDDALDGTVTVTYTGLDAIYYRLEEIHEDDAARKEYMEGELKRAMGTGADVTMTNQPDWNGVEKPLVVEYKVRVRGWASSAGKHLLMPIGLFGADEKHAFELQDRVHPIYFHYPEVAEDNISIALPAGWQVASMPKPHGENIVITEFNSNVENKNDAVQVERRLSIDGIYLPLKYYPALREFYQNVRSNDEEQIVLVPGAVSSRPGSSLSGKQTQ